MGEADEAKRTFAEAVLEHVPLVRAMYDALQDSPAEEVDEEVFMELLEEYFNSEDARAQFDTAVDWGRHAGLFDYDADDEALRTIPDVESEH